ncbi:MAG: DUF6588 family protein [Nonlabens sp.]
MKRILSICTLICGVIVSKAQNNVSEIIGAGLIAAQDYADSYVQPAGESFAFNLSTGWYDDAKVLDKWKFEISLRGQATFTPDDKRSFTLDPSRYAELIQENYDSSGNPPARIEVTFADGSSDPRQIATALGSNVPSEFLLIRAMDGTTGFEIDSSRIELGQGLESEGVNFIPTVFVQAGLGLGNGLELKARFMPRVQIYESEATLWGGALQWEFSKLFEDDQGVSAFPLRLAFLAGYTTVNAQYDFEDGIVVAGTNQTIEAQASTLTLAGIVSTRWKYFNFFGGVNYANGSTQSDLLGTYTIQSNSVIYPLSTTFNDPITVNTDASMLMGTLGAKLSLGFFSLHGSYTFSEFSTANAAVAFKF